MEYLMIQDNFKFNNTIGNTKTENTLGGLVYFRYELKICDQKTTPYCKTLSDLIFVLFLWVIYKLFGTLFYE